MKKRSLIKEAFVAAICRHQELEAYKDAIFENGNVDYILDVIDKGGVKLTKKDFLEPDSRGNIMIMSVGAWENFEKITTLLAKNGESFTEKDFKREIFNSNTLVSIAENNGKLHKIFNADMWQDNYKEMEKLWYLVSNNARRGFNNNQGILPVKREIYKRAGKKLREDELKDIGFDYREMFAMFTDRRFDHIDTYLKSKGDRFKKEDFFFLDSDGDTLFFSSVAWNNFEKVTSALEESGERLEISDYLYKARDNKRSVLERAVENDALFKVFSAKLWVGRIDEMVELWSHVKDGSKGVFSDSDFDEEVAIVEDNTYSGNISINDDLNKEILNKPLNSDVEYTILPLGLMSVWENIDKVEDILAKKSEKIELSDLRNETGFQSNNCIMIAAKAGYFDKVIDIAVDSKDDNLKFDDITKKNIQGNSLIQVLCDNKEIKSLFDPKLWIGRETEMHKVWLNVPLNSRKLINYEYVRDQVNVLTLKSRMGKRKKISFGKK